MSEPALPDGFVHTADFALQSLDKAIALIDEHHRLAADVRILLHNGGAGPNLSQLKRADEILRRIAGLPPSEAKL